MPRRQSTKPVLKLRPTDGMLEDLVLAIPVHWLAVLRVQAGKLNLSTEDLLVQFCGHLADQAEALAEAVQAPHTGVDVARFRLAGGLLKSFQREADRTGLPIVTLMHRLVADAAEAFAGRKKTPLPKPLELVAKRRKWLWR